MTWLPEPIFDKWMAELKGGMYVQGQKCLRNKKGCDCCLGVLLDIIDPTRWVFDKDTESGLVGYAWHNKFDNLPIVGLRENDIWLPLDDVGCNVTIKTNYHVSDIAETMSLTQLNDKYQLTFPQIAAVCEYYSDQFIKKTAE